MNDLEHRVERNEQDLTILRSEVRDLALNQVRTETTLGSLDLTLRELKTALSDVQAKPENWLAKILQYLLCFLSGAGLLLLGRWLS